MTETAASEGPTERSDSSDTSGVAERADARTEAERQADAQLGDDEGLSGAESARRLQAHGPNALAEHRKPVWLEFLSHFWGPIPWLIEAAAVLSAIEGRIPDLAVIVFMLLLNGVVGFWQEHQAGNAIDALKQQVAAQARVHRDGAWQEIAAAEVVPGDLIAVGLDQVIPADGALLTGTVSVDESALTGESLPVDKQAGESLFSGTTTSRGAGTARVSATGAATRFGHTAELVQGDAPPSHFQQAVLRIGRYLVVIALVLVAIIVGVSLGRGNPVSHTLELALVVAIASIPVALPTVLSVTMAVGARALARQNAIVSKLPALEELAGVQKLLVDKTGTITRNEITVHQTVPASKQTTTSKAATSKATDDTGDEAGSTQVLGMAALATDSEGSDPIDTAIRAALPEQGLRGWEPVEFTPFDPQRKRAEALVRDEHGREFRTAKGAVQSLLELAETSDEQREQIEQQARSFAADGMRTLAVAATDEQDQWQLVGVLALRDPPRDDATDTLTQAQHLGVQVRMLTGDRVEIGQQIATEIGLTEHTGDIQPAEAVRPNTSQPQQREHHQDTDQDEQANQEGEGGAQEQDGPRDDQAALVERVDQSAGFAQVVPEDKHRIATALQGREQIVAMTGDGVNDTPALRKSEVGIAVAGATDAARAASDLVLTDPGLGVVVDALRLARATFRRMVNYTTYRITETIRVVLFVTITIIAFGFFPISPIQVILLALLNDIAILSCAYDRAAVAGQPVRWRTRQILLLATMLGATGVVSSIVLLALAHGPLGFSTETLRTLLYLKLSVGGHLTYFVTRSRGPFWTRPHPSPIVLAAVLGTQVVATIIAVTGFLMPALSWPAIALAWGWGIVWMFATDAVKLLLNRKLTTQST